MSWRWASVADWAPNWRSRPASARGYASFQLPSEFCSPTFVFHCIRIILLTRSTCRTGAKNIGHPTVAKVSPIVSEEDPSRKRKADEVVVPADSAKKAKGDEVVTVSDDTAIGPSEPVAKAALPTNEGSPSHGAAEPASLGAGASIAMFPHFMARVATASGTSPSSHAPGVADTEVEQRRGHTPALLASVDAIQLHGMLGAAIQVCPVPEDQAGVLQRSDSFNVVFLFFASSPRVRPR